MKVIKRNGKVVNFEEAKIKNAIQKCLESEYKGNINYVREATFYNVQKKLKQYECTHDTISVEQIQDIVEKALSMIGGFEIAKAYTLYRYKRELVRNSKAKLMEQIAEKLQAKAIENQNANVDESSFGGRAGEAMRLVMKEFALDNCMSEMARNNHLNNEIYIHKKQIVA